MKKVIWMVTPQHTGTQFVRHFLELHPQINYWVHGAIITPCGNLDGVVSRYQAGMIDQDKFKEIISDTTPIDMNRSRDVYNYYGLVPPPKDVRYVLFHTHGDELKHPCVIQSDDFKRVVTFRDPLLSIITALRRTNNGEDTADAIIRVIGKIRDVFWEKNSYKICIDLPGHRDKLLDMLKWLDLPETPECRLYADMWPTNVNSTIVENKIVDPSKPALSKEFLVSLRQARAMAFEGRVHSVLVKWVDKLRESNLQDYFENLGYKNLAWFKG